MTWLKGFWKFIIGFIAGFSIAQLISLGLGFNIQNLQGWQWQETLAEIVNLSFPHLIVIVFGIIIGIAEIQSVFNSAFIQAIRTNWGKGLLVFNAITAEIVYILIILQYPSAPRVITAISVGIGFPTLLRTRFTLKKSFNPKEGDFTFGLDKIYQQFQKQFKDGIDKELILTNSDLAEKLVDKYSEFYDLYRIAQKVVNIRDHLTLEERAEAIASLEKIFTKEKDEKLVLFIIAKKIIDLAGISYVQYIIDNPPSENFEAREKKIESYVKKYTREDLKKIAQENLSQESDDIQYVENILSDDSSGEDISKATVIEFLLSKGINLNNNEDDNTSKE
jgi:hypothetical protein